MTAATLSPPQSIPAARPLPPAAALRVTAEELPPGRAREALRAAADRVAAGADPHEALSDTSTALPPTLATLIDLPTGGRLPEVLTAAAAAIADEAEERRQLEQALLWPVGVAGATLLVAAGALGLLSSSFRELYDNFGAPTPWLTDAALTLGAGLRTAWFVMLPLGVAGIALPLILIRRGPRVPWPFRLALRPGEQARMCELLAVLVEARVPLPDAIRAVGWICPDAATGLQMELTADAIQDGSPASVAASRRRYLPVQLRSALRREDDPAALAEALRVAGGVLRARLSARLGPQGMLAAIIQPALMAVIGAIVLLFAGALLGPTIDLLNDLS